MFTSNPPEAHTQGFISIILNMDQEPIINNNKEALVIPFPVLYHILPKRLWEEVKKSGCLMAKPDLTNTWGVFMLEPLNFLKYWESEISRWIKRKNEELLYQAIFKV